MAKLAIDFEWTRRRADGGIGYECVDQKIRQVGRPSEKLRPLEIHPTLYLDFAKLSAAPAKPLTAEAIAECVKFAKTWGLLTMHAREGAEEDLHLWQREIKKMKGLIAMAPMIRTANSRRVRAHVTSVDISLESRLPDARPALVLQARTLLDAMLVQFAQSTASGNSLHVCAQCGEWFEVGAGADAKRSVAKFCSDRCRNRHHYERRIGK